ncbi:MAG: transcriptional regulator [Desulfotalea sp.]|nr:MAG: transcriptional regulator [Desulfotalea sp.]
MPVYEYECKECKKVFEFQQKMADAPLTQCPECEGPMTKLMSMSSFQLKGGGWYADGYSSPTSSSDKTGTEKKATEKPASCKEKTGCSGCPAASTS